MAGTHELLRSSIMKHAPLTDGQFEKILALARERKYKKGQFLIHEGSSARKTHFIKKGAAIAYFIDPQGSEHLIQFAMEGWWISDIQSYISAQPALLHVQAFEDCELYEFQAEDMKTLYKEVPPLESYFLTITQNAFASFQERVLYNLSLSAEERYKRFIQKYPTFEQRFPQKLVASYIGLSAEFLSKIKKRLN